MRITDVTNNSSGGNSWGIQLPSTVTFDPDNQLFEIGERSFKVIASKAISLDQLLQSDEVINAIGVLLDFVQTECGDTFHRIDYCDREFTVDDQYDFNMDEQTAELQQAADIFDALIPEFTTHIKTTTEKKVSETFAKLKPVEPHIAKRHKDTMPPSFVTGLLMGEQIDISPKELGPYKIPHQFNQDVGRFNTVSINGQCVYQGGNSELELYEKLLAFCDGDKEAAFGLCSLMTQTTIGDVSQKIKIDEFYYPQISSGLKFELTKRGKKVCLTVHLSHYWICKMDEKEGVYPRDPLGYRNFSRTMEFPLSTLKNKSEEGVLVNDHYSELKRPFKKPLAHQLKKVFTKEPSKHYLNYLKPTVEQFQKALLDFAKDKNGGDLPYQAKYQMHDYFDWHYLMIKIPQEVIDIARQNGKENLVRCLEEFR